MVANKNVFNVLLALHPLGIFTYFVELMSKEKRKEEIDR